MSNRTPRTRAEAKAAASTRSRSAARPGSRSRSEATRRTRGGAPKRRWPRRILLTLLTLFLLGVAAVGVSFALVKVPAPNEMATRQTSIIYYADGKTPMDKVSEINRENEISKVPEGVRHAVLAAEDQDFYTNGGISPKGIARAVWVAIKGGKATQGGSTITQQYVRNYFLTQDRTISRKYKEIIISMKIDGQQSKDTILENYLNTIYFGRSAYGIKTASQAYFGKDVSRLTPEEGAVLAAIIRGPSYYDPMLGAEQKANVKERWGYILDAEVKKGWMTQAERDAAKFPMPDLTWKPRASSGPTGYITQLVKDELRNKVRLTDEEISGGGLKVVSTIEAPKQRAAVAAVKDQMPSGVKGLHVGIASIKPGDGAVVALYGGKDYATTQFSSATDATIQAGSTFKIFGLISALMSGDVSTRSVFPGRSPQYFPEFKDPGASDPQLRMGGVRNFGNSSFGSMTVRQATASSVNTIYARLNIIGKPKATVAAARSAGVTTPLTANYANVFGTDNVKVIDMANAYATIAANGKRAEPYFVKSVRSPGRAVDYKAAPTLTKAFDADLTSDVIDCMRAVVQEGSGAYAASLGRPAAGKTGTTSDNYGAWFDGFVPQLATAVGIYKGDGSLKQANRMNNIPGVGELTGGSVPVRVWTDYMKAALEGSAVKDFPTPAHINKNAQPATPPPANNGGGGGTGGGGGGTTQQPSTTPSSTPSSQPSSNEPPPSSSAPPGNGPGGSGPPGQSSSPAAAAVVPSTAAG